MIIAIILFIIVIILCIWLYKITTSHLIDKIDDAKIYPNKMIVFYKDGTKETFHGSCTVWRYDNYKRCDAGTCLNLSDVWHKYK